MKSILTILSTFIGVIIISIAYNIGNIWLVIIGLALIIFAIKNSVKHFIHAIINVVNVITKK